MPRLFMMVLFVLMAIADVPLARADGPTVRVIEQDYDDAYTAAFGISTLSLDYTMVDVGVLPGGTWSYAYGLNNQGQVVGER